MPRSGQPRRSNTDEKGRGGDAEAELVALGVLEVLSQDPRPTFILDLIATTSGRHGTIITEKPSPITIMHRNPALHSHFALNELISGRAIGHSDLDYIGFRDWVLHQGQEERQHWSPQSRRSFGGTCWTAYTVRSKYRIVSGHIEEAIEVPIVRGTSVVSKEESHPRPPTESVSSDPHTERSPERIRRKATNDDDGDATSITSTERHAFGCTDLSVPETRFSSFVQFFRSLDWASTVLGPMEEWSLQLHLMCNFLMHDPTPAYVLWGPELIVIYNEAAIQVLLDRHPRVMGMPLHEVYPEVWSQISILIHKVQKTGKAVRVEDVPMLLKRRGRMDECFFSFQYQPITDEKGIVLGIYEPFVDVTRQNHAARRLALLLEISSCSSVAKDISDFWRLLLEALDTNEALPFAMLYTLQDPTLDLADTSSDTSQTLEIGRYCELEGQLGIPRDHVTFVSTLHLSTDSPGYGPAMTKAMETGAAVFLTREDDSLPESFVQGIDLRGISAPANTVVVWPICPTGTADTVGFLVMALNPHLGFDESLNGFFDIMIRQIATSVAAVMLFEDEVRHREHVAQQLDLRTKELLKSETKFQAIADNSLVGIVDADSMGNIVYANQAFYDITGHQGNDKALGSWLDLFPDEAASSLLEIWTQLHINRRPVVVEYPLKKQWRRVISSGETLKGPTWVLISAFVEEDDAGTIKGCLATITDISQQKWAEEHQKRRMEEAMEMKRQQENFVDMTSHEIRNPLSAIIQSADSIRSSLATCFTDAFKDHEPVFISRSLLEDNMDAAETIVLCAQHQKRIVDDILTLSKMDADMLLVTPVDVEPLKIVQSVVKMFETESTKHGILVTVKVDDSFHKLGLHKVRLDPSRLTQVLVNILGNAIKFTRLVVAEKRITINVSGSIETPDDSESGVEYIRPHDITIPNAFIVGSSTGSLMCFMRIAVHDTGPGLRQAERERLFKRFGQASPRTEVEYGGSGLGLFISKKLSELQGGAIGLSSEPGRGSIFAFYVLVQRLVEPDLTKIDIGKSHQHVGNVPLPEHRSIELLVNPRPSPPVLSTGAATAPPTGVDALRRKLAILVVEDNLVNQRVLCKQLRNLGHIVHAANQGQEALEFLEKSTFWIVNIDSGEHLDIVLLDTEMPVMDGLTCARMIRKAEGEGLVRGHVPIISVTANARSEQVEIARAAGMDDSISKPFRIADLVPKMNELVLKYGI